EPTAKATLAVRGPCEAQDWREVVLVAPVEVARVAGVAANKLERAQRIQNGINCALSRLHDGFQRQAVHTLERRVVVPTQAEVQGQRGGCPPLIREKQAVRFHVKDAAL